MTATVAVSLPSRNGVLRAASVRSRETVWPQVGPDLESKPIQTRYSIDGWSDDCQTSPPSRRMRRKQGRRDYVAPYRIPGPYALIAGLQHRATWYQTLLGQRLGSAHEGRGQGQLGRCTIAPWAFNAVCEDWWCVICACMTPARMFEVSAHCHHLLAHHHLTRNELGDRGVLDHRYWACTASHRWRRGRCIATSGT